MEHNFFEQVMEQKPRTNVSRLLIVLILIAGFAYLLFGAGMNVVQYFQINQELETLRAESAQHTHHVAMLTDAQTELTEQIMQFSVLIAGDIFARLDRVVTAEFLETVADLTPSLVRVDAINVSGIRTEFSGQVGRLYVTAQFQESLRTSDIFSSPLVQTAMIVEDPTDESVGQTQFVEGPYNFTATANIVRDAEYILDAIKMIALIDSNLRESGVWNAMMESGFYETESFIDELFASEGFSEGFSDDDRAALRRLIDLFSSPIQEEESSEYD